MRVPYIPPDAPFSGDQRAWLGGFLAGLHSRIAMGGQDAAVPGAGAVAAKPIDIVYGTQTGNAEELANEAAALAKAKGFAPRVAGLDEVTMDSLAKMETLLVVISTYGEGEMPDNAELFWEALSAPTAPRLEQLNYAVLALGDTSYEYFCQAGKLVDTRLGALGAKRLATRLDCDVDYEEPANAWLEASLPTAEGATGVADAAAPKKSGFSRKNPYRAKIVDNRVLSGEGSAKEIRHIGFDLGDSGLTYEAGDALGVMPVNHDDLVEAWLGRLGVPAETPVAGKDQPLGELLKTKYEIMTPSKELLEGLNRWSKTRPSTTPCTTPTRAPWRNSCGARTRWTS